MCGKQGWNTRTGILNYQRSTSKPEPVITNRTPTFSLFVNRKFEIQIKRQNRNCRKLGGRNPKRSKTMGKKTERF